MMLLKTTLQAVSVIIKSVFFAWFLSFSREILYKLCRSVCIVFSIRNCNQKFPD